MCHDLDSKAYFLTCYRSAYWGWDAKPTATRSFRNLGRRQKPFTGRLGCLQNAVDSVARYASNSRATSLRGPRGILMRASPGGKNKAMERDGVRMSSVFRIAVLSGMALLWVIVAVLQYKWATQLSAATEVRMGSNLQSLMTRWQRELYDWQTSAAGKPELLRLDPNAKTLDSLDVPQELETLLARLQANSSNLGL